MKTSLPLKQSIVIFMTASFLSICNIYSQDKSDWGLNFGATYTSLWGNDYARAVNYDVGILLGLHYGYEFTPGIILVANVNYERRTIDGNGIYFNYEGRPTQEYNFKDKYHYLNIPILIKVPFGQKELWHIDFGPFIGLLLDDSIRNEGINSSFKSTDYGLTAGLGKEFPSKGKSSYILELQSELGLANTMDFESFDPNAQTKRTSTIKLIFTWVFN